MQRAAWLFPLALVIGCASTSTAATQQADIPVAQTDPTPAAQTVLTGSMVGADGTPLKLAHVRLTSAIRGPDGKTTTKEVAVGDDGSFELRAEGEGYYRVELTGVDHAQHDFGVLLDGKSHDVKVKMGTYPREPKEKLTARGRFMGPSGAEGKPITFELEKTENGGYSASIERPKAAPAKSEKSETPAAPSFRYQITDLTTIGRTVNGTSADSFEYDGGGDYWAVLPAPDPGEKLEVAFDPKALPAAGSPPVVEFGDPSSVLARVAVLSSEFAASDKAIDDEMREKIAAFKPSDASDPSREVEELDPGAMYAELARRESESIAARLESEENPLVRRVLLVRWAALVRVGFDTSDSGAVGPSPQLAVSLLEEVSAVDPLWSMASGGIHSVVQAAGAGQPIEAQTQLLAYENEAIADHPDVEIGAGLLLARLRHAADVRDLEAAELAKQRLQSDRFKGTRSARMMIWFDPTRPLAAGNQVPAFEVASLDGKRTFKPSDFEGKILVLDFWATWCGPCKADMPVMHAAYADANGKKVRKDKKYRSVKNPKVEFLSISFDAAVEDPKKYHATQWPMPWNHAFVPPDDANAIRESLGIMGIPTLVVVDADGTIIASTPNMSGARLGATLSKLLARKTPKKGQGQKPEEIAKR